MKKKRRLNPWVLLLSVGVLFFILANIIWLSLDTLPPSWDQSHHLYYLLEYSRQSHEAGTIKAIGDSFLSNPFYPPFFQISTIPVIKILGFSEDNAVFVNILYLVLLTASIYKIGAVLFNRRVGVFSALLVMLYPSIFVLSRQYLLDFALTAVIAFIQFTILKCRREPRVVWAVFLGGSAGAALLIKPAVAVIFILPNLILFLWVCLQRKRTLLFFLSIAIALSIASPWYINAYPGILRVSGEIVRQATYLEGDPQGFISSFIDYNEGLKNSLVSPVLLLFFFIGVAIFLLHERRRSVIFFLASWILIPYLILVLFPNKDARYLMPFLPAFAILTIAGIDALPKKLLKNILFLVIFAIGYFQFDYLSFRMPFSVADFEKNHLFHPPINQDWRVKEILVYLADMGKESVSDHIVVLPNIHYFNANTFEFYNKLLNLPFSINAVSDTRIPLEDIKKADILITKTSNLGSGYTLDSRQELYEKFQDGLGGELGFTKIKEFELPDDSRAEVFKKTN